MTSRSGLLAILRKGGNKRCDRLLIESSCKAPLGSGLEGLSFNQKGEVSLIMRTMRRSHECARPPDLLNPCTSRVYCNVSCVKSSLANEGLVKKVVHIYASPGHFLDHLYNIYIYIAKDLSEQLSQTPNSCIKKAPRSAMFGCPVFRSFFLGA